MQRREFIKKTGKTLAGGTALLVQKRYVFAAASTDEKNGQILNGEINKIELEKAVELACYWLSEIAQIKTESLIEGKDVNNFQFPYKNWKGAIRGEYTPGRDRSNVYSPGKDQIIVKAGTFSFFCPIWHTGHAVKALSLAYKYFRNEKWLESAKLGAEFILRHQIRDKNSKDFGCILAFEDFNDRLNTSAIIECCDGLFFLSDVTANPEYRNAAIDAIDWVVRRLYIGKGLFHDAYNPSTGEIGYNGWKSKWGTTGRPLLDDGVLLKAWEYTKNETYRKVFFEIADRLLETEEPPGNWINYIPCDWKTGRIHPRHAFWWGRPMWMAYKESGERKYLDCFNRACDWYVHAMRNDGGLIRGTYRDFSTDSFGHATSGTGAACVMFHDQYHFFDNSNYLNQLALGLKYMMSVQVTEANDPNMKGVIIEKVLPPNNSDALPWHIRDIGTIFFISSATLVLLNLNET